jgi:hypothetical protein
MSNLSYQALIKILDGLRREAPMTEEFSRFHSSTPQDVDFSRGQAFIHLFLLAKFGVSEFITRHENICEGGGDGGLDAFYIDEQNNQVYLIQSKFKQSATGFRSNEISAVELNTMSIDNILSGKEIDVAGTALNEKVRRFQQRFNELTRKYPLETKVVFLANLARMSDAQVRRYTANKDYEIFNFERSYIELVKPVCSATYFEAKNIKISFPIDLHHTSGQELCKTVHTSHGKVELSAYFVPTIEIGKFLSRYKNAVLEFNPRNYLGLSDRKNFVNPQIRDSILKPMDEKENHKVNDFALLNNGITILATRKKFLKETGIEDTAFLHLEDPQLINGGQTAYTLSELFQSNQDNLTIFDGKEVLVRVIVPILQDGTERATKEHRVKLIESVSYATNFQTPIKEADRRSNSIALGLLQTEVFKRYGRLIEVKRGEFYDGINKEYITKDMVINRVDLLRSFLAFSEEMPNVARSAGEEKIFDKEFFAEHLEMRTESDPAKISAEVFFATIIHKELGRLEKLSKQSGKSYGNALRYGKYAVLFTISTSMNASLKNRLTEISADELENQAKQQTERVLSKWLRFERAIQNLRKYPNNATYYDEINESFDFDNYYKGKTIASDIRKYNWKN